jgi:hypothetical protein
MSKRLPTARGASKPGTSASETRLEESPQGERQPAQDVSGGRHSSLYEIPGSRGQPAGRGEKEESLSEDEQIGRAIDVGKRGKNRGDQAVSAETRQNVAEGKATAPTHATEESSRQAPQTDQVEPAIGTGPQDGIAGAQFAESLAQRAGLQQRRVRSDHHCRRVQGQQLPERAVQTRPKVSSPLARRFPSSCQAAHAQGSAGAEEPARGDFGECLDLANRVGEECRLEIRGALPTEDRHQARLGPSRLGSPGKDADSRKPSS